MNGIPDCGDWDIIKHGNRAQDHTSKKESAQRLIRYKRNGVGRIEKLCMICLYAERTEQCVNIRVKFFEVTVHCGTDTPNHNNSFG